MAGVNAVASISPCSTICGPRSVALMPATHCRARFWAEAESRAMVSSRQEAATGIIKLSSKMLPDWAATVIVWSLPSTFATTMVIDSMITGLTFPGMIELPG